MDKKTQNRSKIGIKSFYHKILIFLILFFSIFFFFLRLFYPESTLFMIPDFGESDVLHFHLPLKEVLSQSLKNQNWPLWTPYIANGFPLLAEGQIGTFYLPNLISYRFLPTITAYNINLTLAYLFLALGTYLFTRSLGLGTIPSFFASLVFTFCGFFSVHLNHYDIIQTASLLPFIFWASKKIWTKPNFNHAILWGFLTSQQIFAGYLNIVFVTMIGVILFWAGLLAFNKKEKSNWRRRLFFILLAFLITLILSAIQLLPTLEIWKLSSKSEGLSFDMATNFPYPYKHFLSFINPYFFGSPADGSYPQFGYDWGIFWENTAYLGIFPLILAGLSLLFIKEKVVKIFIIVLAISILLVLGRFSPLYFIFSFPPFNFFRVPSRFLLLTSFSLTILSSFVLEKLLNRATITKTSRINAIASICYKYKFVKIVIIIVIFLFILVDEYRFSYHYPPTTPASLWQTPPQSAEFLEKIGEKEKIFTIGAPQEWNKIFLKKGWKDIYDFVYLNNSLYPNYNLLYLYSSPDLNMGGLIPRRIGLQLSFINDIQIDETSKTATISAIAQNALSLAGVKYLVSYYSLDGMDLVKIKTVNPPSDHLPIFNIYENPKVYSPFYFAYKTSLIQTDGDVVRKFMDEKFVDERRLLIENKELELNLPDDPKSRIEVLKHTDNEYIFRTFSSSKSILVNTVTNYPGWQTTVDGRPVNVYTVNVFAQGIPLAAGEHTVHLFFRSSSFELGKRITIGGSFIIFLTVFLSLAFSPQKVSRKKQPFLCL